MKTLYNFNTFIILIYKLVYGFAGACETRDATFSALAKRVMQGRLSRDTARISMQPDAVERSPSQQKWRRSNLECSNMKGQEMRIHPTAVVHTDAVLAEDVEVGPNAVIEAHTEIGQGCVIGPNAVIRRYTVMGKGNFVDSGAVLGGDPQDLKFDRNTVSHVRIGDNNTFKECVTINRATSEGKSTTVGNNTYWMCYGHAGHDVTVGDNVIVAANTQIEGHCTVYDDAILPANGNIHQHCWIGAKVMFQGGTQVSMHVPPYVLAAGDNNVVGLNAVGLKRDANLTAEDRKQIKEAFAITYRSGGNMEQILESLDACKDFGPAADKFRKFVKMVAQAQKPYNRGLCPKLSRISTRKR